MTPHWLGWPPAGVSFRGGEAKKRGAKNTQTKQGLATDQRSWTHTNPHNLPSAVFRFLTLVTKYWKPKGKDDLNSAPRGIAIMDQGLMAVCLPPPVEAWRSLAWSAIPSTPAITSRRRWVGFTLA
jgi:hypothetical protein